MCGRFTIRDPRNHPISSYFGILEGAQPARFNVAPSNTILVGRALYKTGSDNIELMPLWARFGFLPHWAKPGTQPQINARGETVAEKPFFRDAFKRNRCLVPADGWYEWKTEAGKKVPYYIQRPDHTGFFFAGLYSSTTNPDGTSNVTFCIVTSEASEDLRELHDRMPVVVEEYNWVNWLDKNTRPEVLAEILKPAPPGLYLATRVSTFVNRPANEGPGCIEPEK
ncbi:MAG TPA: SOS response-associated peptidase [Gammaproteobacteria bacterium]|nr:SOS response-associated peptidase [Gammaproteobacteria bacterium]